MATKPRTPRKKTEPRPIGEVVLVFRNRKTGEPFGPPIVIPESALNPKWKTAYLELTKIPLLKGRR